MKLIPLLFKTFFDRHSFKELHTNYHDTKSYVNSDIRLDFIIDNRHNEISINLYKTGENNYITILSVFEIIMPTDNKDVFSFLKNEYSTLDPSLVELKKIYPNENNAFLLLTVCSVLTKYYHEIVKIVSTGTKS
jgi:hypothetical protein